jgi:hypothetical protein
MHRRKMANTPTNTVLNEIPNNSNMTTELGPNEMEYDHPVFRMVYLMGSPETVKISTKR